MDATFQHPFQLTSQTVRMLRCNIHFSNFEDALDATLQHDIYCKQLQDAVDATFQHPFHSTSQTLWMLRWNIHFKQLQDAVDATLQHNIHFNLLPGRSGCYVVTSISINFEHALDATMQQNSHVKQLQDAVDATFQHPFQSTSRTLWMLRCNIHFNQLRRSLPF